MLTDINKRPRRGTIRYQLIWGNAVLLVLLLLAGAFLIRQSNRLNSGIKRFQDSSNRKENAIRVQHASTELISLISNLGLTGMVPSIEEEINAILTQLEIAESDFVAAYEGVDQGSETYLVMHRTNNRVETISERVTTVINQANQDQWSAVSLDTSILVQEQELLINDTNRLIELANQTQAEISIEFVSALNATVIYPTGLIVLAIIYTSYLLWTTNRNITGSVEQITAGIEELAAGSLNKRVAIESKNEFGQLAQAFNRMTERLLELISGLELRVAGRNSDLERNSALLQAASSVAGVATSIRDPNELIQNVVELIRDRFDLYYVGLFLVDQAGEWAVLQSGTGEAGKVMLNRKHRIKIGEGMIGWSIANAQPRIALEAGVDAVRLATTELPETRSEAAIPLRSRGQVLGALTVQDSQPEAFDDLFIEVLQTMANQVAIAIDNARLLDTSQETLETTQRIFGDMSSRAWLERVKRQTNLVFRSDEMGTTSSVDVWRPEMEQALQEGKTVQFVDPETSAHALAIPIYARDQMIGVLDTYKPVDEGRWTLEEISIIEAIVDEVGITLESARLFEESRQRVAREELVREISDQMQQATDMQSLMQIAVEEIKQALGVSRTYLRFGSNNTPSGNGDSDESI